jgi:hypothetical protein
MSFRLALTSIWCDHDDKKTRANEMRESRTSHQGLTIMTNELQTLRQQRNKFLIKYASDVHTVEGAIRDQNAL